MARSRSASKNFISSGFMSILAEFCMNSLAIAVSSYHNFCCNFGQFWHTFWCNVLGAA